MKSCQLRRIVRPVASASTSFSSEKVIKRGPVAFGWLLSAELFDAYAPVLLVLADRDDWLTM